MNTVIIRFNNDDLFGIGRHAVEPMTWRRESVDSGFAGLNGVVSIDLGRRERKIKQRGCLRAVSVESMLQQIENISAYINGQAYTLVDQDGVSYANVRMDSFVLLEPISASNQASCEYEIMYTQLSA